VSLGVGKHSVSSAKPQKKQKRSASISGAESQRRITRQQNCSRRHVLNELRCRSMTPGAKRARLGMQLAIEMTFAVDW
jgi:hypothetical protein